MNFKADFNIIFALEIGPTYNNYFFEFEQNIVFLEVFICNNL